MIVRHAMLFALVLGVGAAAGCPGSDAELAADDGAGDGLAPGAEDCAIDADCAPAGSTCCECPSFALPVASGWQDSCGGVDCSGSEPAGPCPITEAACELGVCVLRCAAIACDVTCPGGFTADGFGCLQCACADPSPPAPTACVVDGDCVQVPADCCGCAHGGEDTAVPASEADAFTGALDCGDRPICPGVDTCDLALTARCLDGECGLAAAPEPAGPADAGPGDSPADPQYCGDDTLPACPPGLDCVLNHPDHSDATALGLGVCLAR